MNDDTNIPPLKTSNVGTVSFIQTQRVTVNLTPQAQRARDELVALLGYNMTDVINRALSAYLMLEQAKAKGERVVLMDEDGKGREVAWF